MGTLGVKIAIKGLQCSKVRQSCRSRAHALATVTHSARALSCLGQTGTRHRMPALPSVRQVFETLPPFIAASQRKFLDSSTVDVGSPHAAMPLLDGALSGLQTNNSFARRHLERRGYWYTRHQYCSPARS